MKILIGCEESQAVCIEFRKLGFEAYSCDLLPSSGGHPEWHLQMDAIKALYSRKWDLVIAHPVCKRLANSGVRWLASKREKEGYTTWNEKLNVFLRDDEQIWTDLFDAAKFFNHFVLYGKLGHRIVIENPIQHSYAKELINDKYSQIIQPWQFGHGETKATCLWVYNLPLLKPTDIVEGREQRIWKMAPGPEREKMRSKTFPGIAKALAQQYGNFILDKHTLTTQINLL